MIATHERLHKLTLLLVFLTFDLILFGAFTRLTDSGLGCPDWPGCYAHMTPVGAAQHIQAAQNLMPTGPVTHVKAWIEMLHRYFATAVGALIVLRLIWSIQLKQRLLLPVITFSWVCLQGALGAWTVTMKLFPLIVTGHLLGGMVLLTLLTLQLRREQDPFAAATALRVYGTKSVAAWLMAAMFVLWVQFFLGAWVSTNYAVLACNEFPTCINGVWAPTSWDHVRAGFTLWRHLGLVSADIGSAAIDFSALTAIHLTHRAFAVLVLLVIAGLIVQLKRYPQLRGYKRGLMALLSLQIITGISTVVLGWPLLAAMLHTAGAAAFVLVLTRLWMTIKT